MFNPNNFSYLDPTSFEYLYLYPIFCSIIAGIMFWYIFSYLPEKSRRKSFGVGVLNDLLALNQQVFGFYDFLMRHQDHSPSFFQNKIQSSTLAKDEISTALQNKLISKYYLTRLQNPNDFLIVGEELVKKVTEIDVVINRLYSFNYYLSPTEVSLIRNIHEKVHRYIPYIQSNLDRGKVEFIPINPSISFMTVSLIELQNDFREFRSLIFKNKLIDRDFIVHKVLWLFNSEKYKECVKECKAWTSKLPLDSSLFDMFLIRSYHCLNNKKMAYEILDKVLLKDVDLVSHRSSYYPLIADPIIHQKILSKCGAESILKMNQIVESEKLQMDQAICKNQELVKRYKI